MTALLGFRPALAAPGRSASFAGVCCLVCLPAAGLLAQPAAAPALTAQPHTPPPTCAVYQPLRKPAVRRHAAADPPAPLPPPPAGSGQDSAPPHAAQRARHERDTFSWSHDPSARQLLWQCRILFGGTFVLFAAYCFWQSSAINAWPYVALALVMLLLPL